MLGLMPITTILCYQIYKQLLNTLNMHFTAMPFKPKIIHCGFNFVYVICVSFTAALRLDVELQRIYQLSFIFLVRIDFIQCYIFQYLSTMH